MKYIIDMVRVSFARKVLALLFALLVWWRVSVQIGSEEVIRNVPVNIVDNRNSVLAENLKNPSVNLVVRTVSRKRGILSPADIKIYVHLPLNVPDGGALMECAILRDAEIKKPFGMKLLSSDPDKIMLKVDRRASKEVPVAARLTGMLSEDYACGGVTIVPPRVMIYGPEILLKGITKAQTEQIPLDASIKEGFEKLSRVESPGGGFVSVPEKVMVQVEVYKKNIKKTFRALPVYALLSPVGAENPPLSKLAAASVDVTVSGPASLIEQLEGSWITPFIRIAGNGAPSANVEYKIECHFAHPELKLVSVSPPTLKFAGPQK